MSASDDVVASRFWDKVSVGEPDECWEWQGGRNKRGYGQTRIEGKWFLTSRLALAFVSERMSDESLALHSCDNPPCCNPHHLRWGSRLDNRRDALERNRDRGSAPINRAKTHCNQGHPFSGDNLVYVAKKNGRTSRRCRTCARAADRRWKDRVHQEKLL